MLPKKFWTGYAAVVRFGWGVDTYAVVLSYNLKHTGMIALVIHVQSPPQAKKKASQISGQ